jgi:hypothetical protein
MAEDGGGDSDRDQHQQQQPAAPEGRGGESVKLFVGQVPKQMTEPDLAAMFRGVALVDEVTVIRDRATRVSRGTDPYASLPPHLLRAAMQCGSLRFARIWARVSSARPEGARVRGSSAWSGGSGAAAEPEFLPASLLYRCGREVSCFAGRLVAPLAISVSVELGSHMQCFDGSSISPEKALNFVGTLNTGYLITDYRCIFCTCDLQEFRNNRTLRKKVCCLRGKTSFVSHKVTMKWSINHWPCFSLIVILFQTTGEWSFFILVCLNLLWGD